ncbi:MAG: ABC transporter permease, partial [Pararhodobacter sp.]
MHPVLTLVIQRLALGLLLLLAASVMIFAGTMILPGDVAQAILGQNATPQALANMRAELGLDRPAVVQYFDWLFRAVQGDLGTALSNRLDIATSIAGRLRNTLFLAAVAAAISVPLAIFLGLLAVRYRDRWPDKLISAITLTSISLPEFLLGYVIMYVFAVQLGWFPSASIVNDSMIFGLKLHAVALPAMVLTL